MAYRLSKSASPDFIRIFTVKYDSAGNLLWVRSPVNVNIGGSYVGGLSTDAGGNTYITGYFFDSVTFGTYTLMDTFNYTSDIFIVKYNSAGNVIWAKCPVAKTNSYFISGAIDGANSISADASGNVYATGFFTDTLIFDHDTLINLGLNGSHL